MRYNIDKNNGIEIFEKDSDVPFISQPTWPNNEPFSSELEAKTWAELTIESLQNPESEFVAGHSPDQPKIRRQTPIQYEDLDLTVEPTDTEA